MFTDPEFYQYVDGVSLHWYLDWNTTTSMLDTFHAQYPEMSILYTETCINDAQSCMFFIFLLKLNTGNIRNWFTTTTDGPEFL